MPTLRNNAMSVRELLCVRTLAEADPKRNLPPQRVTDRATLQPGEEVEVEKRFLETEGAKQLLESGDLELVEAAKGDGGAKGKSKAAKGDGGAE